MELNKAHNELIREMKTIEDFCEEDITLAELRGRRDELDQIKSQLQKVQSDISLTEDRLGVINISQMTGPICANLKAILEKLNLKRQKYHSKSFVGNDCNRYADHEVFTVILDNILETVKSLSTSPEIMIAAKSLHSRFLELFSLFSDIHKNVSHSTFVTQESIESIEISVSKFMSFFRKRFPDESITLKMHLMERQI